MAPYHDLEIQLSLVQLYPLFSILFYWKRAGALTHTESGCPSVALLMGLGLVRVVPGWVFGGSWGIVSAHDRVLGIKYPKPGGGGGGVTSARAVATGGPEGKKGGWAQKRQCRSCGTLSCFGLLASPEPSDSRWLLAAALAVARMPH